eukprot:2953973-Prymnesium_polylepis.1
MRIALGPSPRRRILSTSSPTSSIREVTAWSVTAHEHDALAHTRRCTHISTRGYAPVCPDGAPYLPACP